ncbi:MAG: helix-turn-helix transcriptional regulator [Lachnospiraceae bacterium]|nr:helix-turn-helix transcriptional regulator [Lachnospiraceae bacterium]
MIVYDSVATCNNIFALCSERGWSDSKLARMLAISPQAISKWRRGVGAPSTDSLVTMSDLFQVSLDDLLGKRQIDMSFYISDEH